MANLAARAGSSGEPAFMDPRARLLFACLLSIVVACLGSFRAALAALGMAILALAIFRPPSSLLLKGLAAANFFILFIWALVPWTTPGAVVWRAGFMAVSDAGLRLCALVTVKANALALVFLAMVATMPVSTIGGALSALRCPRRLVFLFLLMGRNIHILSREWSSLNQAARLRAFKPGNNRHTYRTMSSMLAILLVRAQERGERMREAMLLRGFNGKLPGGGAIGFTWRGGCFGMLLLVCLIILIYLDLSGSRL